MSLKDWVARKLIERELDGMRKEGKLSKLWAFLDGKKRLLGGALSSLALLAAGATQLAATWGVLLPAGSKFVIYTAGAAGVLTWLVGALHKGWKLYYGEEHA